jgi:hypothetical protein
VDFSGAATVQGGGVLGLNAELRVSGSLHVNETGLSGGGGAVTVVGGDLVINGTRDTVQAFNVPIHNEGGFIQMNTSVIIYCLSQDGGTTRVEGGVVVDVDVLSTCPSFNIKGGTVAGTGTFNSHFSCDGCVLAPDGDMIIHGDVDLEDGASLTVRGWPDGSTTSLLNVSSGTLTLDDNVILTVFAMADAATPPSSWQATHLAVLFAAKSGASFSSTQVIASTSDFGQIAAVSNPRVSFTETVDKLFVKIEY